MSRSPMVAWRAVGPPIVATYRRGNRTDEWIESYGGDTLVAFPEVPGAIGYDIYIEPGDPLIERPGTGGTYYWRITPVNSKQLIQKGRKP